MVLLLRRRLWLKPDSGWADYWSEVWKDHWSGKSGRELLEDARQSAIHPVLSAAIPESGVVLEMGCGHGQWLEVLGGGHRLMVGVDRYPVPMGMARGAGNPGALVQGDVAALPFASGTVAAVLSLGLFEHFEGGFGHLLAEVDRVLRPGGILLVSVPYFNYIRRILEPFRCARAWLRANRFLRGVLRKPKLPTMRFYQYAFTTAEFRRLLAASGFCSDRAMHFETGFGLTRDYGIMRALRRRTPRLFATVHEALVRVSPRSCAHMQLHVARRMNR